MDSALSKIDKRAYRDAVSAIVRRIQRDYGLTDKQLADRISCSAGTIKNARNSATNLDGVMLARIEKRFGPGAIDPFLALADARAMPISSAIDSLHPTLAIVDALHKLIETQTPESEGGTRITSRELTAILSELREARNTFDVLIMIADPALGSAEPAFRDKAHKRVALVHTEGGNITHATVVHSGQSE